MKLTDFPFSLPFILDGATGTELTKRGMPKGASTEEFVLNNPDVLKGIQAEYIAAGTNAVLAPTFGANKATLARHGISADKADGMVKSLADISLSPIHSAGALVAGDMSPTGLLIAPYGDASPEEIFDIYRDQAQSLIEAGVDYIMFETMVSAAELRLGVMAVRSISKTIPIFASLTVDASGKTMNGDTPAATLVMLSGLGIQAFGCNCSIGPEVVYNALKPAAGYAKAMGIPLIAKPNAGMPEEKDGGTFFPLTPEDMAAWVEKFASIGAYVLGGCCGTTPAHIAAIAAAAKNLTGDENTATADDPTKYAATPRKILLKDDDAEFTEVSADDPDSLSDLLDEADPDDVLYLELGEGGADVLIENAAFITNPVVLRGDENEIAKAKLNLAIGY